MSLTGISQFVLGFALAIGLLFASGVAATRYLLTRVATPPPRPTFSNDPSPAPAVPPAAAPAASAAPAAAPAVSPVAQGYAAKVTQPIGLIVRKEASVDSVEVGGVDFNQQVTVLEDSADGGWQKVRLADGTEGWVKGGNTEKVN
ncbi:SH3 domain-containing protein [Leptolyngbya ohadii]|uniref:SH3 domain-containing protein n=1 Tax=Leptolyngbya ohadii TaxID=1962290 RepID=UPI000B59E91D|nr:SH3 domain-containing protein [Leptolyngbya ohadii]